MTQQQMEDDDVKRRLGVGATDGAESDTSPDADEQAAPTPDTADDTDDTDDEEDQE